MFKALQGPYPFYLYSKATQYTSLAGNLGRTSLDKKAILEGHDWGHNPNMESLEPRSIANTQ